MSVNIREFLEAFASRVDLVTVAEARVAVIDGKAGAAQWCVALGDPHPSKEAVQWMAWVGGGPPYGVREEWTADAETWRAIAEGARLGLDWPRIRAHRAHMATYAAEREARAATIADQAAGEAAETAKKVARLAAWQAALAPRGVRVVRGRGRARRSRGAGLPAAGGVS